MHVDHENWVRAGRRMNRAGEKHERECQSCSKCVDRQRFAEELVASNTAQRPTQMAAKNCPWLSCGSASEAEEEDGGSAKGGEQERIDLWPREEERGTDADGGANQTPQETHQRVDVHVLQRLNKMAS